MKITNVNLETVCGITSPLPKNSLPEVAFCGRSNVGKSSLLNTIMGRKSLARTSQKPGKTQTINFYNADNKIYLVDLPGYGYAKVSKDQMQKWGDMIERYLTESETLRAVFQLIDLRHEPTAQDKQMYDWITYLGFQNIIIATKADKLKPSQLNRSVDRLANALGGGAEEESIIIPFSSVTKSGKDDVLDLLAQVIENEFQKKEPAVKNGRLY